MADISVYLAAILSAVYGEDVRGSIHDAIEVINDVSEVVLTTGTAVTSASSSSEGFYVDSLYFNTDTDELWKCVGTDTWESQGILKGADGDPGAPGENGNKWYIGTGISGKAALPTVYSGSGIANANENDCYLNNVEGAVYHCVSGGIPTVATWVYDFTMTGGGGGDSVAWSQVVTTGTKIASININGTITDVYAPNGGSGSTVAWSQIQTSSGATKIAEITIDGVTTDVYAPSGGGSNYDMIDNADLINDMNTAIAEGTTNDDVVSAYGVGTWSNCDALVIYTTAAKDADTVGQWDDDWTTAPVDRTGWLWHKDLYGVLSNDDVTIEVVFDISESETVGLAAYRIDDNYQNGGVNGGCVAFKFTSAIQAASGVKVGLKLINQRTKTEAATIIT